MITVELPEFRDMDQQDIWNLVDSLRPLDNVFMHCMLERNVFLLEKTVRILLQKHDLTIDIDNPIFPPHPGTLDTVATDKSGNVFMISLECVGHVEPASLAGMRVMNINHARWERNQVTKTPHQYLFRIAENDPFGENSPVYAVEMDDVPDEMAGIRIVYVNGAYRGDNGMGCLMHDFRCASPDSMGLLEMSKTAQYYKRSARGMRHVLHALFGRQCFEEPLLTVA
ncbi:MAG: hypothetical protein IJT77_02375 [Clostridia bacterium]|nr:hypothetical protein [Clostridia bacterium]